MIVNYLLSRERASPVNLGVARVLLGTYLLWKVAWYEPRLWTDLPFVGFAGYLPVVPPASVLVVEKWLLVVALVAFVAGYRTRWTALAAALLLGHLATVRFTVNTSGGTTALFFSAYILLFFALFARQDDLSLDGLRRTGDRSIESLRAGLTAGRDDHPDRDDDGDAPARGYPTAPLLYAQLVLGVIYFGAGLAKVVRGGPAWVAPDNLSRVVLARNVLFDMPADVGSWLLAYPGLVTGLAVATVVLEVGLLVALLARLPVWPVVVGLVGMHLSIAPLMGMVFFDPIPLFALFVAWDRLLPLAARTDTLDVVFDERCFFCARSLTPFAQVDVGDRVRFYSQSDVPARYATRTDVDFATAMYAFRPGEPPHEGYDAFRELLRQVGVAPAAAAMNLPGVRYVGRRVYRYVAANRSTYFVCAVDLGDPAGESTVADAPDAGPEADRDPTAATTDAEGDRRGQAGD